MIQVPVEPESRRKCALRFLELLDAAGIKDLEAQLEELGDVLLTWRKESSRILRNKKTLSEDELRQKAKKLMARYSPRGQEVIRQYFSTLALTRKTQKLSPSIVVESMEYWNKFPEDVVIQALTIHLAKYPDRKEAYTRGIIRGEYERRRRAQEEVERQRAREMEENRRLLEKYRAREQEVWGESQ